MPWGALCLRTRPVRIRMTRPNSRQNKYGTSGTVSVTTMQAERGISDASTGRNAPSFRHTDQVTAAPSRTPRAAMGISTAVAPSDSGSGFQP